MLRSYGHVISGAVSAIRRRREERHGFGAFGDDSASGVNPPSFPPVDLGATAVVSALDDFWHAMSDQEDRVKYWNDLLYKSLSDVSLFHASRDAVDIDNWHTQALNWMQSTGPTFDHIKQGIALGLLDDANYRQWNDYWIQQGSGEHYDSFFAEFIQPWIDSGQTLINNAKLITMSQQNDTLSADLDAAAQAFPTLMRVAFNGIVAAGKTIVKGAADIAKTAAWSTAEIALVLGGAALLLLYGLNKSGVKLGFGPFSLGK